MECMERLVAQLDESRALERKAMAELFAENLREQKKARLHKNLFRFFIAGYLLLLMAISYQDVLFTKQIDSLSGKKHTAVVDILGAIMPEGEFSGEKINLGLNEAFKDPDTVGVVLRINSPGGSPVQSSLIYDEMQRLRAKYPKIPLFVAIEDLCASGGYWIATGAQEIFVNPSSLVGSIGVIMRGFGFQKTLDFLGIENRLLTAGKNKAFLDPFGPVKEEENQHAKKLLNKIHQQFIETVKKGRGDRLKIDQEGLFEGLIWTGDEAVQLGLADGVGSVDSIARERLKTPKTTNFSNQDTFMDQWSKKLMGSTQALLGSVLPMAILDRNP
ncbi:MAG: S49 family peptidase [Magnetococcus sp. DMHC-6]